MNAGLSVEGINDQTRIVRKRHFPAGSRCGERLDARVRRECLSRFTWLLKTQISGRLGGNAIRREQFAYFLKLACIVGGDYHRPGEFACHCLSWPAPGHPRLHITAILCKPTSFSMPLRASASSAAN